jgi:hypothetical protein
MEGDRVLKPPTGTIDASLGLFADSLTAILALDRVLDDRLARPELSNASNSI